MQPKHCKANRQRWCSITHVLVSCSLFASVLSHPSHTSMMEPRLMQQMFTFRFTSLRMQPKKKKELSAMALDTTTLRHPACGRVSVQRTGDVICLHEHLFRITSATWCCAHSPHTLNGKRRRFGFEGNKSVKDCRSVIPCFADLIHFPHIYSSVLDKWGFTFTLFLDFIHTEAFRGKKNNLCCFNFPKYCFLPTIYFSFVKAFPVVT